MCIRDRFDTETQNFGIFLGRKKEKFGDINVQPYKNFKGFIKRITRMNPDGYSELEAEIQQISAQQLTEKQWLLQEIRKLK